MIIVSCDKKMKFHFFIVRDASPSLILSITLKMIILQRRREFWMEVLRLRILSRTNREDVFWNGDFRVHTLFMILLPYVFRKIYHSSDPPRPPLPTHPPPFFKGGGSKCWLPTRRGGILKILKKGWKYGGREGADTMHLKKNYFFL